MRWKTLLRKEKKLIISRDAFCVCRSKVFTETTLCHPEIKFSSIFDSDFQEMHTWESSVLIKECQIEYKSTGGYAVCTTAVLKQ